jgi:hypothetical protein
MNEEAEHWRSQYGQAFAEVESLRGRLVIVERERDKVQGAANRDYILQRTKELEKRLEKFEHLSCVLKDTEKKLVDTRKRAAYYGSILADVALHGCEDIDYTVLHPVNCQNDPKIEEPDYCSPCRAAVALKE